MSIFYLALKQLIKENKAEIKNGIPIYDNNELLDYAIKIRKHFEKPNIRK